MTEIVMPQHTNALGSVFGGTVVSWVDVAAAACALRHCGKSVVTASIDAMHFLAPIRIGWIVTLRASVNFTARTSCEIGVRVEAENPLTGEKNHTASAYLTFVALGSDGKPTPIPPVRPESKAEKSRFAEAEERRQARLELKNSLEKRRLADKS